MYHNALEPKNRLFDLWINRADVILAAAALRQRMHQNRLREMIINSEPLFRLGVCVNIAVWLDFWNLRCLNLFKKYSLAPQVGY